MDEDSRRVVQARPYWIDLAEDVTEPSLGQASRQLRRREEGKEKEEADRETHLVRAGESADEQPEGSKADGQDRPDSQDQEECSLHDRQNATKHTDIRDGYQERGEPQR